MASKAGCSKTKSPLKGYMNLSNWLIKYPKSIEKETQVEPENETAFREEATSSKSELVVVEWYPIQSGFLTIHQNDGDRNDQVVPVLIKIGTSNTTDVSSISTGNDKNIEKEGSEGFFKLGKGKFNHKLAICHSKEKEAMFFNLSSCYAKATFDGYFLSMTIKPENHIEDLQTKNCVNHNSGTVVCRVKFASEQTAQCFENALRKLACVLRCNGESRMPRLRVNRKGNQVPIASISDVILDANTENKVTAHENGTRAKESPLQGDNSSSAILKNEDCIAMESEEIKEESISPTEESKILLDLFNTFSNPYSRHVRKGVKLYLTGNNNAIGPNLAKDVQHLINTRQGDIEKYVSVLRKTNMAKSMK